MAFIGLDRVSEELTIGISAAALVLPVTNGASLCVRLGAGTSKLKISDGVYEELVYVTSCTGNNPVVVLAREGTAARAFAAGSCVSYVITTTTICDLINSGDCDGLATCLALEVMAGSDFPAADTGLPYAHALAWTGTSPATVTVLRKPSWMVVTPTGPTSGNSVVLSGTPGVSTDGDVVQLAIANCGGKFETNQRLVYCTPAGAAV